MNKENTNLTIQDAIGELISQSELSADQKTKLVNFFATAPEKITLVLWDDFRQTPDHLLDFADLLADLDNEEKPISEDKFKELFKKNIGVEL